MNYSRDFYVKPASHEVVDATVSLAADKRPALVGTVLGRDEKPVPVALVTIYRADAQTTPIGALYTDELGRFAFGPLEPGMLYHIKVFQHFPNIRTLEQDQTTP